LRAANPNAFGVANMASVTIHDGLGNVEVRLRLTPTYELCIDELKQKELLN